MGSEKIITVTTTATKLLDLLPTRKEYIVQNQGSVTIYLGISSNVAVSGTRKGRELSAGVIESANDKEDSQIVKEELYGIVSAGSADVWVWEA